MSTIIKTDAVVLRTIKFGETSLIVNFFTEELGRISGIVKGARRAKSPFGSSLQSMSYVSLVLYTKEGRDIQTVAQCDVVRPLRNLMEELEKMAIGMSIIELVNAAGHEEQCKPLFILLVRSLAHLNDATLRPENVLYRFELKLAEYSGFAPKLDRCVSCGALPDPTNGYVSFDLSNGGVLCGNCPARGTSAIRLTMHALNVLRQLGRCSDNEEVFSIEIEKPVNEEVKNVLRAFLLHHIAGMRNLKSEKVFSEVFKVP